MKAERPLHHARMKARSQLAATWGLTRYALLASVRNRGALVFSLIFPLAFTAIFGIAGSGGQHIHLGIPDGYDPSANPIYRSVKAIADQPDSPVELDFESQDALDRKLRSSDVDAILEPGATATSLNLRTTNGNPTGQAAAQTLFEGVVSKMNLQAAGVAANPTFTISNQESSGRTYKAIDFALPGQIGFSLISLATFGVAFSFISLRQTLVLKRLFATTVTPLAFVASQGLSRMVQAVLQAAVIIYVGVHFFDFNLINGWETVAEMLAFSALAIICFLGFGILISNLAKDEQTAPIVLNLFNLPQFILSGVFFSTAGFPAWLQTVGNLLPLSFFTNGMRELTTEGKHLDQIGSYLLGMAVWSVIAYFLAARTYKSE